MTNSEALELRIREATEAFDYNTQDFPIERIIKLLSNGQIIGHSNPPSEWDETEYSEFIESIMVGCQIPIYAALITVTLNPIPSVLHLPHTLREIVAGKKLFNYVSAFAYSEIALSGLTLVPELNGVKSLNFTPRSQRKFERESIRIRVFSEVTEEAKKYLLGLHQ